MPTSLGKHSNPSVVALSPLTYTKAQVAALMNISPRSVMRIVERGLLRPNRILRKLLFSAAQVHRLIEEGTSWE